MRERKLQFGHHQISGEFIVDVGLDMPVINHVVKTRICHVVIVFHVFCFIPKSLYLTREGILRFRDRGESDFLTQFADAA